MKIVLLILVVFISSTFSQCINATYGVKGSFCDDKNFFCKNFLTCQHHECKPGHLGARCEHHSDCFLSELNHVKCIEHVCNSLKYNGEHCDSDKECYGGICTFGFCVGKQEKYPCNPEAPVECAEKLYCSKKTKMCEKRLNENDSCDDFIDKSPGHNYYILCPIGTACTKNKKCEKIGKKVKGDICIEDIECIGIYSCMKSENENVKRCGYHIIDDLPCGNRNCSSSMGEACFCINNQNGTKESVCKIHDIQQDACNYTQYAIDYQQCWKDNGCPLDFYQKENGTISFLTEAIPNGSCMSEKCGHILRQLLCCSNSLISGGIHEKLNYFPLSCDETPSLLIPAIIIFSITMVTIVISSLLIFGISLSQMLMNSK
eukprot:gene3746-6634_t